MKANRISIALAAILAAGMMAMPVMAKMNESAVPVDTQTAEAAAEKKDSADDILKPGRAWDVDTDMEDQIYTIRIKALGSEKEGYYWENYTGDRGDATCIELLTQSTQEEGLAYAGSFRVVTDQKTSFEDYIRLVYTNGIAVDEYMDFNVLIEDGEFEEITGGSHYLPVSDEDYAKLIEGEWAQEKGGNASLRITLNPESGFDCVLKDAKAKEFSFHAEHDGIKEAFVYKNTDESLGLVAIDPSSESEENIKLIMHDLENAGDEDITFVKAK